MASITAQNLINGFEYEQKTVVFSALSDYLHLGHFTDVTLVCRGRGGRGPQQLGAHKIVLASSSKFFRDLFRQNPHTQAVDLDKELAPNDLLLTFEDVQLIIGILYCIGTVEISPQRIQSLLVAAQILGIPTLIRFLKKIKDSLGGGNRDFSNDHYANYSQFHGNPLVGSTGIFPATQSKINHTVSRSGLEYEASAEQDSISGLFHNARMEKREQVADAIVSPVDRPQSDPRLCKQDSLVDSGVIGEDGTARPSRSESRATLASLDSFSLPQLPSPPREAEASNSHPSRVVSSVLESFDPSFLNHLPANQIDDLENALLPHLHSDEPQQPGSTKSGEISSHRYRAVTLRGRSDSRITDNIESNQRLTEIDEMVLEHRQSKDTNSIDKESVNNLSRSTRDAFYTSQKPLQLQLNPEDETYLLQRNSTLKVPLEGFSKLLPSGNQNLNAEPVILRPDQSPRPVGKSAINVGDQTVEKSLSSTKLSHESSFEGNLNIFNSPQTECQEGFENDDNSHVCEEDLGGNEDQLIIDEEERCRSQLSNSNFHQENDHEHTSSEIRVNLEVVNESKSFKFAIPGSSKSVTLNFSADALQEMRNSVTKNRERKIKNCDQEKTEKQVGVISTELAAYSPETNQLGLPKQKRPHQRNKRKLKSCLKHEKSDFKCHICEKSFRTKVFLDKHLLYHVEVVATCKICGKLFYKKWALEQHLAVDHGTEKSLKCSECDKVFKWPRNLLAHIQLCHVEEKRYRCKFCPLTFLQRKSYVNHQQSKHSQRPNTWCKLCLEVFTNTKLREDHTCPLFENTGSSLICHRHNPAMEFSHQADMEEHMKSHLDRDNVTHQKKCCPVCQKKFLMKKNLHTHMRRFHEGEGRKADYKCGLCEKKFYFKMDCKEHENTHTGEKNFHCHCGKQYSSKKALLHHQKLVHVEKNETYTCTICGKELSNKYKLKYHMSVHSEKRNFKCSFCDAMFKARENLSKHVSKQHKRRTMGNESYSHDSENRRMDGMASDDVAKGILNIDHEIEYDVAEGSNRVISFEHL